MNQFRLAPFRVSSGQLGDFLGGAPIHRCMSDFHRPSALSPAVMALAVLTSAAKAELEHAINLYTTEGVLDPKTYRQKICPKTCYLRKTDNRDYGKLSANCQELNANCRAFEPSRLKLIARGSKLAASRS